MTEKIGDQGHSGQLITEICGIHGRRITAVQTIKIGGVRRLILPADSCLDEQQEEPLPYLDVFKSLEKLLSKRGNALTSNQFSDIAQLIELRKQQRAGVWKGRSLFAAIAANRHVDPHTIRENIYRGLARLLGEPYGVIESRVRAMNSKEPDHHIAARKRK